MSVREIAVVAFDIRLGLVDFFGRWRLPGGVNVCSARS